MTTPINQHAIVLGGSMAGLLTARILADHFKQVTIIERDQLPTDNTIRKGVPQAKHLHILLAKGDEIITGLFPGLGEELDEIGANLVNLGVDVKFHVCGEWLKEQEIDLYTRTISRAELEARVRGRVKEISKINFREQTDVLGLIGNPDGSAVTGVAIRNRRDSGIRETLSADFVVDATGRRSKAPKWLTELGYQEPEETIINATVGYATRHYHVPVDALPTWRMVAVPPEPPFKSRGGGMMIQEDGSMVVTLLGTAGDLPPLDEAGFSKFAQDAQPEIAAMIGRCQPKSPIIGYRKLENQWRHYEKMAQFPERFMVIGDAFCAFNPIYGQGMTAAALEADCLGVHLSLANGNLDGVARHTMRAIPSLIEGAWTLAAGEDLRWETTTGKANTFAVRITPWLSEKIQKAMPSCPSVAIAFAEVQNLIKPPTRFFRPDTFAQILWHSWRNKGQNRATAL